MKWNETKPNEKRCDEKPHLQNTKILLATFYGFDFSIVLAGDMNVCTLCWKSIHALSNLYPIYIYKLVLSLLLLLLHFSRRLPFVESAMKRLSNVYHMVIFLHSCSLSLSLSRSFACLPLSLFSYHRTSFVRSFLIGLIRWCAGLRPETHHIDKNYKQMPKENNTRPLRVIILHNANSQFWFINLLFVNTLKNNNHNVGKYCFFVVLFVGFNVMRARARTRRSE